MKINLLYLLVLILVTSSCQKNSDSFDPYPLDGSTEFLNEEFGIKYQSKLIDIDEATDLSFDYSKVNIDDNSIITSGDSKIMLHWKESKNALDVFLSGVSSSIGESFLMPSYYFEISLSNGGEIDPNNPITIFVEVESLKGLDIFKYDESNKLWEVSNAEFEVEESVDEAGEIVYGTLISIDELGKYSLGTKVNFATSENRDVCISLPGEYNSANSISFVKLQDNIVVSLDRIMDLGTFCKLNQLPVETKMTLVVLTNIRKDLFEIFIEDLPNDRENVDLEAVLLPQGLEKIKDLLEDI